MRTGEGIELRWEAMLKGIHMQADWLRSGPDELLAQARELLHEAPPRIYLTGCGDSHFAGIGARLAFERWSGIPTQAVESLELSRYELELAPAGSWVVCVSNSGRVVRTVEAAAEARSRGLTAIAVTYAPESRLAETADGDARVQLRGSRVRAGDDLLHRLARGALRARLAGERARGGTVP